MSLRNAENSSLLPIFSCFRPSDNMTKQLKIANGGTNFKDKKAPQRQMLRTLFKSDPTIFANVDDENISILYSGDDDSSARNSTASLNPSTPSHRFAAVHHLHNNNMSPTPSNDTASPYLSPYTKSPWTQQQFLPPRHSLQGDANSHNNWLMGSLVREEGHVYSLATSGDLLYTGSDSKNIRVWKNLKDFAGFKSNSGLVKAIVVFGDKIFTGHQDGKIRVWKLSGGLKKNGYKRVGNLPTTRDFLKSSFNPKNYVEVRRHRNVPWIKHYDAVSCMAVDVAGGLLYSGSWDKSLKVWRLSDSKCLESIAAHDDAVNSVVIGFDGMVFTGSADGTVKAWRRELVGKQTKHVLVETMLQQESAVTSLALNGAAGIIYAGSSDGLVNFWEFDQKHFVSHGGLLRGHKLAVLCQAVAGNLVFSGSADKSICVWRRETGGVHTCISVLTGHTGPVKCLAVEEDGEYESENGDDKRWTLYSGSLDKSVMVWRVSDHAVVNK